MNKKDLARLDDPGLEMEIAWADKQLGNASNQRRTASAHTSEAGLIELDVAVSEWSAYERALLAERSRRQATGRYNPQASTAKKEVVVKGATVQAPPPAAPAPATRRATSSVDDDEPEQPPIIVFDKGIPRTWRPGDPIH